MIHFISNISRYNWIVEVFIVLNIQDIALLKSQLLKYSNYTQMLDRLYNYRNSGFSYSKYNKSILVIGIQDSLSDFIDTFNHEKNHIETYIGDYYNLTYNSEEFSIMSGYLAKILFTDLINQLISTKYIHQ